MAAGGVWSMVLAAAVVFAPTTAGHSAPTSRPPGSGSIAQLTPIAAAPTTPAASGPLVAANTGSPDVSLAPAIAAAGDLVQMSGTGPPGWGRCLVTLDGQEPQDASCSVSESGSTQVAFTAPVGITFGTHAVYVCGCPAVPVSTVPVSTVPISTVPVSTVVPTVPLSTAPVSTAPVRNPVHMIFSVPQAWSASTLLTIDARVPDVTGSRLAAAAAALKAAALVGAAPEGTGGDILVGAQRPSPDALVEPGTVVTLIPAGGPPSVVTSPVVTPGKPPTRSTPVVGAPGVSTSPVVTPGNPTTPAVVLVPDVTGLTLQDARAALARAGLQPTYTGDPLGTASRQRPAAGSPVPPDHTVTLTLTLTAAATASRPPVSGGWQSTTLLMMLVLLAALAFGVAVTRQVARARARQWTRQHITLHSRRPFLAVPAPAPSGQRPDHCWTVAATPGYRSVVTIQENR